MHKKPQKKIEAVKCCSEAEESKEGTKMLKVDSVLAIDAKFKSKPQIAHFSALSAPGDNSGMSFAECLNSHIQERITSAQTEMLKSNVASALAWYYPPMIISPKVEKATKDEAS